MRVKDYVKKYKDTPQYRIIMQALEQKHFSIYGDIIYDKRPFDEMIEEVNGICLKDVVDYASGATKIAILYNEIVLKKTYSGYVDDEEDEYEMIEYVMNDSDSYNYAPDYCALEALVYAEATLDGLNDFFAEVIRVSNKIYAQLRAERTLSGCCSVQELGLTDDDVDEIREEYGFDILIPDYAIAWWFVHKTSEHLQKFADFLFNHNINDLHASNIGFFNGEVKLFDYSGFNSGVEYTF